jgi:hypothetical protein
MIPEIEKWISTATYGLAQEEIGRIKADIEQHFADACMVYQEKGASITQAEARALADLGDAGAANEKYRALYFTQLDDERIKRLLRRSWWTFPLMLMFPLLLFLTLIQHKTVGTFTSQEIWVQMFIQAILWFGYIFEPYLKLWVHRKSPRLGLLFAQLLVVLLVWQFLQPGLSAIWRGELFRDVLNGKLGLSTDQIWFVLAFFWMKTQLPLSVKILQRLR